MCYDMGRGSTDMSYTWNEYGRPSIDVAYSMGARVLTGQVDAVLHGGDLAYSDGTSDFILNNSFISFSI